MRNPSPIRHKTGFTLIELLVVIAIIGILAGIITQAVLSARNAAQVAEAQKMVKDIEGAAKSYWGDTGRFPPDPYVNWAADAGTGLLGDTAVASPSWVWYLYNEGPGKSYLDVAARNLSTTDTTNVSLQVRDPWSSNYLYVKAIPQIGPLQSRYFPKHPQACNVWSIGPNRRCDSCRWTSGYPPPAGLGNTFNTISAGALHNDGAAAAAHTGGDPIPNDDIQN